MQRPSVVRLGKTDLQVCRIGIGCGNGISSSDLQYAIDHGINYVFHSTDLHHHAYAASREAIRGLFSAHSTRRDDLALVTCSYICDPEKVLPVVMDTVTSLRVDHVDVFQWGWVTKRAYSQSFLADTRDSLKSENVSAFVSEYLTITEQVEAELRQRGFARYLGVSVHDRSLARAIASDPQCDVLMLRYNIAHRGVEGDVFPNVGPDRPGIVAFNVAHDAQIVLAAAPPGLPDGKHVPTYSDLYRYVLDSAFVDVVLAGPACREHIDTAVAALHAPPLDARMREYLKKVGDLHAGRAAIASG